MNSRKLLVQHSYYGSILRSVLSKPASRHSFTYSGVNKVSLLREVWGYARPETFHNWDPHIENKFACNKIP